MTNKTGGRGKKSKRRIRLHTENLSEGEHSRKGKEAEQVNSAFRRKEGEIFSSSSFAHRLQLLQLSKVGERKTIGRKEKEIE